MQLAAVTVTSAEPVDVGGSEGPPPRRRCWGATCAQQYSALQVPSPVNQRLCQNKQAPSTSANALQLLVNCRDLQGMHNVTNGHFFGRLT